MRVEKARISEEERLRNRHSASDLSGPFIRLLLCYLLGEAARRCEIRFHGRGGQGTVVATILMSKAFFRAGYEVQSFPFFGVERRGAPVEAYLRLDKGKISSSGDRIVYTPRSRRRPRQHTPCEHRCHAGPEARRIDPHQQPGALLQTQAPISRFRLAYVDASRIALNNQIGSRTDRYRQYIDDGGLSPVSSAMPPPGYDVFAADPGGSAG